MESNQPTTHLSYWGGKMSSRAVSPRQLNVEWVIAGVLCLFVWFFMVHFSIENDHFDGFFPRKIFMEGKHGKLDFKHDLVTDKYSWYIWDTTVRQISPMFYDRNNSKLIPKMLQRISDNNRWNHFVDFVKFYGRIQCVAMSFLAFLAVHLLRNETRLKRLGWYAVWFLIISAGLGIYQFVSCDYLMVADKFRDLVYRIF